MNRKDTGTEFREYCSITQIRGSSTVDSAVDFRAYNVFNLDYNQQSKGKHYTYYSTGWYEIVRDNTRIAREYRAEPETCLIVYLMLGVNKRTWWLSLACMIHQSTIFQIISVCKHFIIFIVINTKQELFHPNRRRYLKWLGDSDGGEK